MGCERQVNPFWAKDVILFSCIFGILTMSRINIIIIPYYHWPTILLCRAGLTSSCLSLRTANHGRTLSSTKKVLLYTPPVYLCVMRDHSIYSVPSSQNSPRPYRYIFMYICRPVYLLLPCGRPAEIYQSNMYRDGSNCTFRVQPNVGFSWIFSSLLPLGFRNWLDIPAQ